MVRVSAVTTDSVTAWRIRDALAAYPLLGGATAQIYVAASYDCVILEGWALDDALRKVAVRLAKQVAGNRPVDSRIRTKRYTSVQDPIHV
jgi:osmotically-inducible protein OsmY